MQDGNTNSERKGEIGKPGRMTNCGFKKRVRLVDGKYRLQEHEPEHFKPKKSELAEKSVENPLGGTVNLNESHTARTLRYPH